MPEITMKRPMTFRDRLSSLTTHQACLLLGEEGARLIREGSLASDVDLERDVYFAGDLLRVSFPETCELGPASVILTQAGYRSKHLEINCDSCEGICHHMGATLGLLLESKSLLGLAAPPDESVPFELLTREELLQRAIEERRQRAEKERMRLQSLNPKQLWGEYLLTSSNSGKTYRVALLGMEAGECYCSCPDFRTNRLGLCKHILYAREKVKNRFRKGELEQPYVQNCFALYLEYTDAPGVRFSVPANTDPESLSIIGTYADRTTTNASEVVRRVDRLQRAGHDVLIYPDAEHWLERQLIQKRLLSVANEIRADVHNHPLRTSLLKVPLLPYQLDGIAFAVGAGRAILADDMGLGKTIQGIGIAELLAREVDIKRVLVVCPASLKGQWREEIHRFSNHQCQLVFGRTGERQTQYETDQFFTVCNYEQVMRDLRAIEQVDWDLIILDEGQRIKNWESKTSQTIRSLQSRFAVVLSGTPLENRLDELFTVCGFVDDQLLGPAYEFFHRHRIVTDTGRVEGFKQLDDLREKLKPVLLRRTRNQVMGELPERTTSIVRIMPTEEQMEIHRASMMKVSRIVRKSYLTEMDLLQLRKHLMICRMSANSTFLVDKQPPGYSTKLARLRELLEELSEHPDRKIILFSEWTTMLSLIEPILVELGMPFVRLDGQVSQKKRPSIVKQFQSDPDCRVILMSNAGSTGLNLQSANTVINVDLPWNPAVLEQRIARAHRMGQKNPVHVYLLVSEGTLEENLLDTLAMKQDLALAALDVDSNVTEVEFRSGQEELLRRLEQLIGRQPQAPVDQSQQERVEAEARSIAHKRDRVAAAGGQLLGAAFQMLGELVAQDADSTPDPTIVQQLHSSLNQCLERDSGGRPQLRITLPDDNSLTSLAQTLAKLLLTSPPNAANQD